MDASGQLQREAVQLLFQRFDTDGDGYVDTGRFHQHAETPSSAHVRTAAHGAVEAKHSQSMLSEAGYDVCTLRLALSSFLEPSWAPC